MFLLALFLFLFLSVAAQLPSPTARPGIPCSLPPPDIPAKLSITNFNRLQLNLYYVNSQCDEILIRPLLFLSTQTIDSHIGAVYFAQVDGALNIVGTVRVNSTTQTWAIGTPTTTRASITTTKGAVYPAGTADASRSVLPQSTNFANLAQDVSQNSDVTLSRAAIIGGSAVGAVLVVFGIVTAIKYRRKIKRLVKGIHEKPSTQRFESTIATTDSSKHMNMVFKTSPSPETSKLPFLFKFPKLSSSQTSLLPPQQQHETVPVPPIQKIVSSVQAPREALLKQPRLSKVQPAAQYSARSSVGPRHTLYLPHPLVSKLNSVQPSPLRNSVLTENQLNASKGTNSLFSRQSAMTEHQSDSSPSLKQQLAKDSMFSWISVGTESIIAPRRTHSMSTASIIDPNSTTPILSHHTKSKSQVVHSDEYAEVTVVEPSTAGSTFERPEFPEIPPKIEAAKDQEEEEEEFELEPPAGLRVGKVYNSVYKFERERTDELSINYMDRALVQEIFSDGWCMVILVGPEERRGLKGLIPWMCLDLESSN
ncbi:hypothetical protein HK098_002699 [Nowakowskiella sp. JEL0407]|nr:hypothetical protein HK098_002699 [Nowakowskiella sp. JEL0407]